jgi:hypothetical protein
VCSHPPGQTRTSHDLDGEMQEEGSKNLSVAEVYK